jgi:hypothetical protein
MSAFGSKADTFWHKADIGLIETPQCSRAVLSFPSKAREALGRKTTRVHCASWRRGRARRLKSTPPIATEPTYDHPTRRLQLRAASPYD